MENWENVWFDGIWFLLQHSNGRARIRHKETWKYGSVLCCISSSTGGGRAMAWIIFSWNTYVGLVSIKDQWNSTAYHGITTDHVFQFVTTVNSSLDDPLGQHILPQIKNSGIQQWDFSVKVAATLTGPQSHLAPLGCVRKEDLDPGRAASPSRTITGWPHNSKGCNFEWVLLGIFQIYA